MFPTVFTSRHCRSLFIDVCATNFVKNMSVRVHKNTNTVDVLMLTLAPFSVQHCPVDYYTIWSTCVVYLISFPYQCRVSVQMYMFSRISFFYLGTTSILRIFLHVQDMTSYLLVCFSPIRVRTLLLVLVVTCCPEVCFNKMNTASAYVWRNCLIIKIVI